MRWVRLIVLGALVAFGACTESANDTTTTSTAGVTVNGLAVANVSGVLTSAEDRIPRDSHMDARCYFSLLNGEDLARIVRCGPEPGRNKTFLGPWHAHELIAETDGNTVTLSVGRDFLYGWSLLPGERLYRPDGLEPPPDGNDTLPPPTAFDRSAHPWLEAVPEQFQQCMARRGLLVFHMRFLFDGETYIEQFTEISTVEHVEHETLSFEKVDANADTAATTECMEELTTELALSG